MGIDMAASTQQIQKAVEGWSIEVTPAGATKINSFADCLSPGTTVNVTFLPGSDPMETVAVAKRLHNEGMNAVPHLAARSLRDPDQIDALLAAYRAEAGVDEVLIIGGGVDQPVGAFDNSLQILETGLLQKHVLGGLGWLVTLKAVPISARLKLPKPWAQKMSLPSVKVLRCTLKLNSVSRHQLCSNGKKLFEQRAMSCQSALVFQGQRR